MNIEGLIKTVKERRARQRALAIALALISEELIEHQLASKDDIEFLTAVSKRLYKRSLPVIDVAQDTNGKLSAKGSINGHQG